MTLKIEKYVCIMDTLKPTKSVLEIKVSCVMVWDIL